MTKELEDLNAFLKNLLAFKNMHKSFDWMRGLTVFIKQTMIFYFFIVFYVYLLVWILHQVGQVGSI